MKQEYFIFATSMPYNVKRNSDFVSSFILFFKSTKSETRHTDAVPCYAMCTTVTKVFWVTCVHPCVPAVDMSLRGTACTLLQRVDSLLWFCFAFVFGTGLFLCVALAGLELTL